MDLAALLAAAQKRELSEADIQNAGSDPARLKAVGNEAFRTQNYPLAVKAYQKAQKFSTSDTDSGVFASNQAMAFLKLGSASEALAAAESAIKFRPDWDKAYFRKVQSLILLDRFDAAKAMIFDTSIFPKLTDDLKGLLAEIQVGKLPWRKLEDNVFFKVLPTDLEEASTCTSTDDEALLQTMIEKGDLEHLRTEGEYLQDLDSVWLHYRVFQGKSRQVVHSTRAQMFGQGEHSQHAPPPKKTVLAEYSCPDVLDFVLRRFKDESEGLVKITGPCSYYPEEEGGGSQFPLEFHFSLYKSESGTKPVQGPSDVFADIRTGEGFLLGAVDGKEKLDAFDRSKAAADQNEAEALEVAWSVKKGGMLAVRRFRRALKATGELRGLGERKCEESEKESPTTTESTEDEKADSDVLASMEAKAKILLARSLVIAQHVFAVEKADKGDFARNLVQYLANKGHKSAAERDVCREDLEEALRLCDEVLESGGVSGGGGEEMKSGGAAPENYLVKAEALSALERLEDALTAIELGMALDPKNEPLRSERARVNLKLKKSTDTNNAEKVQAWKERLDVEMAKKEGDVEPRDEKWIREMMKDLGKVCDDAAIGWDQLMTIKIGKPIGLIQKAEWAAMVPVIEEGGAEESLVSPDDKCSLKDLATKLIKKFRTMAENNRPLWS